MPDPSEPHIQEAIAAAIELRKRLGIPLDEPFDRDLLDVAENDLNLAVSVMQLPEGVAGAYLKRRDQPFVFVKADDYPTRQRFTLSHEIGHHVLGHETVYESFKDIGRETDAPHEQQANFFASEFLAPDAAVDAWVKRRGLGGEIDLTQLIEMADGFHISPPAMLYRLSMGEFGFSHEMLQDRWGEINPPERKHVELSEEMGIGHGEDQLSKIYDAEDWPRLPGALESNARALHAKGLIDDERLAAVLRRP